MRRAIHQKDFGTPYLKPTGFLMTLEGSADFGELGWPVLDDVGNYVGPLAWRPAPRMKLGKANTAPTAAYPPALCKKIADMLIQTILARAVYALGPADGVSLLLLLRALNLRVRRVLVLRSVGILVVAWKP